MQPPALRFLTATIAGGFAITSLACGQGGDELLSVTTRQTAAATFRFVAEMDYPDIDLADLPPELEGVLPDTGAEPPDGVEGQADLGYLWFRRTGAGAGPPGRADVVIAGERVLVRSDLAPEDRRPVTPWIGFASFSEASRHFPDEVGALAVTGTGVAGPGPEEALRFLEEAGGRLDRNGAAHVRGVATRRYHVAFDPGTYRRYLRSLLDEMLSSAPGPIPEAGADGFSLEELRQGFDEAVPPAVTVWIDDEDRIRRIETVPQSADDTGEPFVVTFRIEFFDFGAPMEVAPPGPEAITEAKGLDLPLPPEDEESGGGPASPDDWSQLPVPPMPDMTPPPGDPPGAFSAPEAVDPKLPPAGRSRLRLSAPPGSTRLEDAWAVVTRRLRAFGAAPNEMTVDGDTLVVNWWRGNVPGAIAAVAAAPGHFSIRPVLDDHTGQCGDSTGGDGEEVSLPGTEDGRPHCYRLGSAVLDRPGVVAATPTNFDGQPWVVDIQLDSQAAAAFDAAATRSFGQRLALVVDGTVISAPTVQAQQFEGRIEISGAGLDELEVRRLAGLLAGGPLPVTLRAGRLEHP